MVLTLPHHPRHSADELHAVQVALVVAVAAHLFFAVWLLRDWHPASLQPEAPGMLLVDVHPAPARVAPTPVAQPHVRRGAASTATSRAPVNEGSLVPASLGATQAAAGMNADATVPGSHSGIAVAFRPPMVLHRVTAAYPDEALRAGHEGETELLVTIAADGALRAARVSTSSGDETLDRAALAAVGRYTFRAAEKGGTAIEAQAYVDVAWRITPALRYGAIATLPQDTRLHDVVESKNTIGYHIDARDEDSARGARMLDERAKRASSSDRDH